jgi:hypothetical protein
MMKSVLTGILRGSALVGIWAACLPAQALEFERGEWLFNVDTTLGMAAQWRTEDRDDDIASVDNDNDGNNNFDTGPVSAKGSFILELGGEYKDFSFFLRTDGLYDYVYNDRNTDLSEEDYLTYNSGIINGGDVKRGDFPEDTVDEHGKRLRLLDAFVSYDLSLGDQSGSIRLGRQVIAWGEATFYQGVNAVQNPIDGGVALSPGVEAKEIFLPTEALSLNWGFSDSISAEAYYKIKWDKSTLPGVGSFLSTSDITGPGAQRILLGPLGTSDVIGEVKPDDEGQFGITLRYLTNNGTNFDLSYTNSHANIPGAEINVFLAGPGSFAREVYLDDIEIWQASFSTNVSEAQVYADIAYSDNAPFVDTAQYINDAGALVVSDMVRGEYWQVVVGMTDIYTAFPWLSESITLILEANLQGNDLGESDLDDTTYVVTEDAWGYQGRLQLNYYSVIPGMDVNVVATFKHDVDGYDAFYLTNWQFSAKYAWYFGNDNIEDKVLSDRDNFALSMKYVF